MYSMGAAQSAAAQNRPDTSKRHVLASLQKKTLSAYIIRKPNVIFPDILKGSEEKVKDYIEEFGNKRRDYVTSMYAKGKNFLAKAEKILKQYDIPQELKVLLALESAYDGNAVSRAGAVGYWQIMDEVAGEYGIRYISRSSAAEKAKLPNLKGKKIHTGTTKLKDDRKNFTIATQTAARYLRDRGRKLDANWLMVVASYNCGLGRVFKAIKKSGKSNPDFWDIKNYLPAETRAYVMNFITLNVIFDNYDLFTRNKLSFASEKIMLPADMDKNVTEPSIQ